jgi:hypothetical protein
VLILSFS